MRRTRRVRQVEVAECLEARQLLSGTTGTETPAIDGTGNNISNPEWGSAGVELVRLTTVAYEDGLSSPAGADRPSAREISNAIVAADGSQLNDRQLTDLIWMWGQFIDHDLDLTEPAVDASGNPLESFPIIVPTGDLFFDPFGTGTQVIDLSRSEFIVGDDGVRQQINAITAFLDGSVIYGSDLERAAALRTFVGGRLKTSVGDLLPFNEAGLENAGGTSASLFLAGDIRANENVALTAMHTIWVREHNRIADELATQDPTLSDEEIYQRARAIVRAELQIITYNEFLPALLGEAALSEYTGYDPTVNPGIASVFSTAAYRFGHTLLSPVLLRLDADGTIADEGHIALRSAFFNPNELVSHGIESLLRGASVQVAQELDNEIVDDVRNFLFGPPGAGGFDLASLNIQRGRDHGLPSYNQARIDLGLSPVTSFSDITSNAELASRLEAVYGDVDNIDVWIGGLAEDHLPNSSMGELFTTILVDQFERLRDGDRFWYENVFSGDELLQLEQTTLAGVISRNTSISGLQQNAFFARTAEVNQHPGVEIIGRGSTGTIVLAELQGDQLQSRVIGGITTDVDWDDFHYGDFNGDGLLDAAGKSPSDGYWRVLLNDGQQLTAPQAWVRWSTAVTWSDLLVGDFNGDGLDDLAGRASSGTWNVSLSTGTGFIPQNFGGWSPMVNWRDVQTADLNGDGLTDVLGRSHTGLWVGALSNGSRFQMTSLGRWSTAVDWRDVTAGDLNGDGLDDVAARASTGTWVVGLSTGSAFNTSVFGGWSNAAGYSAARFGDFNGDGRLDIMGLTRGGLMVVGVSTGTRFQMQHWGNLSPFVAWDQVLVGDFDGDGLDDLASRARTGTWVGSLSTGSAFESRTWGGWSRAVNWDNMAAGNFS